MLRAAEDEALTALGEAVRIGQPRGYTRVFLEEGPHVVALLEKARAPL
jgi:hypothetical protein